MERLIDIEIDDRVILDWIRLPETKYWRKGSIKILVRVKNDLSRFEAIKKRDGISDEYLSKRESMAVEYKIEEFDYIFDNDYREITMNDFIEKVLKEIKE